VLIVEDEPDVRRLLVRLLERNGYVTVEARDGIEGVRAVFDRRPDAVVLDLNMPRLDGWQTLERVREVSDVPVLMLTAQGDELNKVRGLRRGADDYVTKPFGRQELLARIEALLRRAGGRAGEAAEQYEDGVLSVDLQQRVARARGADLRLTPLEFKLLAAFVRHPGQVLSREQIIDHVWGEPFIAADQVKLLVGRLRRKLADRTDGEPIETVRGFGYRWTRGVTESGEPPQLLANA
jgi:DNA-binding response OmpR family regulator